MAYPSKINLTEAGMRDGFQMESQILTTDHKVECGLGLIGAGLTQLEVFLHYTFDRWMTEQYPSIPFERYADDIICHCESETQARILQDVLVQRFERCHLTLHPDKTRFVYCKDANRRGAIRISALISWDIVFAHGHQRTTTGNSL